MKSRIRRTGWLVAIGMTVTATAMASVKLHRSRTFVAFLIDSVKVYRLPGPRPWAPDQTPDPQTGRWATTPLSAIAISDSPLPKPPSLKQLAAMYPQFQHQPFASAGFCPLLLPFRYHDPQKQGDASEANAFSFLLSDALDWGPGNYCRQHAYFIFKRSRNFMLPLRAGYNPATISWLVNHWNATHAVGGSLTRHANGCTGTLEIFDPAGRFVFAKSYPAPRPYFDLLGDMAVDALTFFGEPPNAALVQHLHLPRCQKSESIVRLGMAAFAPEKTPAEFDRYAAILRDDPDFAEVRYWWANQRSWVSDADRNEFQRQAALAMQSRLTVSALDGFSPSECRDRQLAEKFPACVDQAEKLLGPDAPLVLRLRLSDANQRRSFDAALVRRALAAAAKYPNAQMLLTELSRTLGGGSDDGPIDGDLASSLAVAAISNRFVTVAGNDRDARDVLAWPIEQLGHPQLAATLLHPVDPPQESWDLYNEINTLSQAGRFADAIALFNARRHMPEDQNGILAAMEAAVAAATLDDAATLADIEDRWSDEFALQGFSPMLAACQDALAGRPVDSTALRQACLAHTADSGYRERLLMAAQTDLILRRRHLRDLVWQYACGQPGDRLFWVLLDAYERQTPTPQGVAFYDCLAWQYPNDPWVTRAAHDDANRRIAAAPDSQSAADDEQHILTTLQAPVRDLLAGYTATDCPQRLQTDDMPLRMISTAAPPWVAGTLVHDLLAAHQKAEAQDGALRYQNLAVQSGQAGIRAWAGHLVSLASS